MQGSLFSVVSKASFTYERVGGALLRYKHYICDYRLANTALGLFLEWTIESFTSRPVLKDVSGYITVPAGCVGYEGARPRNPGRQGDSPSLTHQHFKSYRLWMANGGTGSDSYGSCFQHIARTVFFAWSSTLCSPVLGRFYRRCLSVWLYYRILFYLHLYNMGTWLSRQMCIR